MSPSAFSKAKGGGGGSEDARGGGGGGGGSGGLSSGFCSHRNIYRKRVPHLCRLRTNNNLFRARPRRARPFVVGKRHTRLSFSFQAVQTSHVRSLSQIRKSRTQIAHDMSQYRCANPSSWRVVAAQEHHCVSITFQCIHIRGRDSRATILHSSYFDSIVKLYSLLSINTRLVIVLPNYAVQLCCEDHYDSCG